MRFRLAACMYSLGQEGSIKVKAVDAQAWKMASSAEYFLVSTLGGLESLATRPSCSLTALPLKSSAMWYQIESLLSDVLSKRCMHSGPKGL